MLIEDSRNCHQSAIPARHLKRGDASLSIYSLVALHVRTALLPAAFIILSGAAPAIAQTAVVCANDAVTVPNGAVTSGTGRGTAGGYLPAGRNWKLAIDDEFDGPQLNTKIWKDWYTPGTIRETNGGMYQDNRRALSFANGHLVLRGFDAKRLPGNPRNLPGTGGIMSKVKSGPGYYEARVKGGSAWAGFWLEGMGPSCSAITDGFEADIFEMNRNFAPHGQHVVHWGGYRLCHHQSGTWINADPSRFYVFGMEWSTERGLTFYVDGHQTYALPSATASNEADIIFSIESSGNPAAPMEVDYFRYYTDAGPKR